MNQWYGLTYKSEPIVFRTINDERTYQAFFPCSYTTPLPTIDFSKNTLLIGMKADYGQFINTPTNISSISQTLLPTNGGGYSLQVKVVGKTNKNEPGKGREWFCIHLVSA
ncbi:hypothetical protein IC229_35165 [Spirosoma sp. BT702]|uniref:Uncharacterized protein n=1 Tax=Spirosoma profusum TaxID=2771354 RepID=A0A927GAY6_9BACT|nr:hypothetical protein [Spirosoma profusum]MBD2705891.1 hypothetical protein [Spirosoma profusum]